MYDIVFISYKEPNANDNWKRLQERFPYPFLHRVKGVDGILNAHKEAAKLARTSYFYVIDGDNEVKEDFDFSFDATNRNGEHFTYVWRAVNPVNNLVYGYGGVKLLHRKTVLNIPEMELDMTTALTKDKFRVINEIASITRFNSSPFEAWKSAFRECAKLSTKLIYNQNSVETQERLETWLTVFNKKEPFVLEVKQGAEQGYIFGLEEKDNISRLKHINDFEWLQKRFNESRP